MLQPDSLPRYLPVKHDDRIPNMLEFIPHSQLKKTGFFDTLPRQSIIMRLEPYQIDIIRQAIADLAGDEAQVTLFGSRTDDNARGGDIDLLVEIPHPVDEPAWLSARISGRISLKLGGRKIDVVLSAPNLAQIVEKETPSVRVGRLADALKKGHEHVATLTEDAERILIDMESRGWLLTRQQYISYSGLQACAGTRRGAQAMVIPLASAATPCQRRPEVPNRLILKDRPLRAGPLTALAKLAVE